MWSFASSCIIGNVQVCKISIITVWSIKHMLEPVRIIIAVALMVVTVFAYAVAGTLIAVPFAAVTIIYFLLSFTKIGAMNANRKISRFTFNAIKEEGIKRIKIGTFHVREEDFTDSVERIKDVLSDQQYFPEFGLDGMFLSYGTEDEANRALEKIKSRGVKADTILDRRTWLVKIEFEQ